MRPSALFASVALPVLVACGGGGSDLTAPRPQPQITGTWAGDFADPLVSDTVIIIMSLSEAANVVQGSGVLSTTGPSNVFVSVDVTGTWQAPEAALTMTPKGYQALRFTGAVVNDTTLSGDVNGSGFSNVPAVFHRR